MKLGFYLQNYNTIRNDYKHTNPLKICNQTSSIDYNFEYLNQLGNAKKAIIHFGSFKNSIDYAEIKKLKIGNFRMPTSKIITGCTFRDRPEDDFAKLKKAGITAMIDLRKTEDEILKEKCLRHGIKYIKIPLDGVVSLSDENFFYRGKNKKLHIQDNFVETLKKFFKTINEETCYMSCRHGIDRTNIGILLNYFLNKDYGEIVPEMKCWPEFERIGTKVNQDASLIKKIFKALSDEQKMALGIEQFDGQTFKEKLFALKIKNYS